jgi:hypothetical protein
MLWILAGLLSASLVAPANVAGKWAGTITAQREDGSRSEDTVLLILDQKDATITGTVGGSETDQHPITSGSVDGNAVTISARSGSGREYLLKLTVENDQLKGTVTSGTRTGQVQATRRKD